MKRAVYFLPAMLIFLTLLATGCTLDFLNNDDSDEEDTSPDYFMWDDSSDIYYWHDGETDDVLWYETYDYDVNDNCILVKRFTSLDTLLWADAYAWDLKGGDYQPVSKARFNSEKELGSYSHYFYNTDNLISMQVDYDVEYDTLDERIDTLSGMRVWEYTAAGKVERTDYYDNLGQINWAYQFEYDPVSDLLTLSSAYDDSGNITAYIERVYSEDDDSLIKKTGYGNCTSATVHDGDFAGINLHPTSGLNTEDRTEAELVTPEYPSMEPSYSAALLSNRDLDYSWMEMWNVFTYGDVTVESYVLLNDKYLPVIMSSDVDNVSEIAGPIEVRLTYTDDDLVDTKSTWYDGHEALVLDFDYNSDNFLTDLYTSGEAVIFDHNYSFSYNDYGLPYKIAVYSSGVLLQSFEYDYIGEDFDPSTPLEYAQGIFKIIHRDGSDEIVADYEFTYDPDNTKIVITVRNPDDSVNGSFEIYYNEDDMIGGIAAFDSDGDQLWNYDYTYEELESQLNRISEIRLDEDDIPEVALTFDIESLLGDITALIPGLWD